MSLLVDLIGVNLVFLLCCIPVITIGPALSALYTITLRLVRNNLAKPVNEFWLAFRQNTKRGILLELIAVGVGGLLIYNTWLTIQLVAGMKTVFYTVLLALCLICISVYVAVLMYLFPLQAQFSNSIKGTLQTAFLMSIRYLPKTFCITAIPVFVGWLCMRNAAVFTVVAVLLFLVGFVLIAYLQSHLLVPVFNTYISQISETEETENVSDLPDRSI